MCQILLFFDALRCDYHADVRLANSLRRSEQPSMGKPMQRQMTWRWILVPAMVTVALCLPNESPAQFDAGAINVKDLAKIDPTQPKSAAGDAKTDDTAAIQAGADLAKARSYVLKPDGGSYLGSSTTLYFPAGHYLITDEIKLGPYTNIVSDSRAIIEQKTAGKKIGRAHV